MAQNVYRAFVFAFDQTGSAAAVVVGAVCVSDDGNFSTFPLEIVGFRSVSAGEKGAGMGAMSLS